MQSWQEWIDYATGKGWKVAWREAVEGYVIITPKAFRRPSEELGHYTEERAAWRAAANLCRLRGE
ncbi:hypothetical protein [Bradyrhizobium sp. CCGB20]|uniref:hypothetical protein n=1 Tax=Bradyrhizobium sp. CCGB20 TaxID=2949633 RepID=UPI0020B2AC1F|nr:hypothetical protein [Bradyrhizobium sp. CCGB20]MCP3400387.1 hypothetical protein [Bradyrhizobium sp. CCGB20]